MSFIETPRFPQAAGLGSASGPEYLTDVAVLNSGHEQRNSVWSFPRHNYNLRVTNESDDLDEVRLFFHSMMGRLHGFRFKDFNDYSSADNMSTDVTNLDQVIGTGDAAETDFQLVKLYTRGSLTLTRNITKPVSGTILVAVDTVAQTLGVDFTVDTTTGIVTFTSPPAGSTSITAGFEFDVPVRFKSDLLPVEQLAPGVEQATFDLIEIK